MGRNAEKRRDRRRARAAAEAQRRAAERAAVAARTQEAKAPPRGGWAEMLLSADGARPSEDMESLSAALFRLSAALTAAALAREPEAGLEAVLREVASIVEADTTSLALLVEDALGDGSRRSSLKLVASHRRLSSDERLLSFRADDELAGEVLRTARPLRIDDTSRDPRFARAYGQRSDIRSLLLVPLVFQGRLLGVLAASRKEVRAFYDIDERRLLLVAGVLAQDLEQARLLRVAFIDPLTGLLSRQALLVSLPREVERSRRYGSPLSAIALEVGGLDEVADRFGPEVADAVLRELGARLSRLGRKADFIARYSPDRFVVIAPVSEGEGEQAAERIGARVLADPVVLGDVRMEVTLRRAAASLEPLDEDAFALLARLEERLKDAPPAAKAPEAAGLKGSP